MIHVNFIDKNNENFVDKSGHNFLVRRYGQQKLSGLTSSEICNMVNDMYMRCSFYLYALWDDETIREDLSEYILEDGSLSIEYKSGVRRNLSISLYNEKKWLPNPLTGFLWKGAKFKLEIGVQTETAECVCPAGIFILKDFKLDHQHIKNKISLEMVDKFGGLDGTVGGKIIDGIYIARGSNILQVVRSLLKSEKINGCPFDPKSPIFPSQVCGAVTPYTINETSGSTIGSLIIKLLTLVNLDVFYDENGRMCCEEMRENMLIDSQPSLWTFSADGDSAYNFHSLSMDFQKIENIVVVEGANINGDIISARVENTNAKSPTNITVFEPSICKIVDENISNLGAATLRANYELFKRSLLPISQEFSTMLIPLLNVNKVVTINDEHCGLRNARFLINSINIPISSTAKTTMKISNLEEVAFNAK